MFLLPNGSTVDIEGVCDALEDYIGQTHYFLDSITGEVGVVGKKEPKKLLRLQKDPRYFQIPSVPAAKQIEWLKKFVAEIMPPKAALTFALRKHLKEKDCAVALVACNELFKKDFLKKTSEGWVHGWAQLQGDELYAEAEEWFLTLPIEIIDKWEGCDDCELCKLTEKDDQTVGDFFEAASKQKLKTDGTSTPIKGLAVKNEYYYDAMELLEDGQPGQAVVLLKKGLQLDKHSVQMLMGLAQAYRHLGDQKQFFESAYAAFAETKRVFPKWPKKLLWGYLENRPYLRAMQCQAEILEEVGKKEEAIELYRLLLKLNPNDNQGVRYVLAGIYAGISGDEINTMNDAGNKKQDWSALEKLVENQNKLHRFWNPPKMK